ncbi:MAG: Mo-dependent nitrogenase C-terminal domain-containing protein [Xenococcaceae cyanobacterium MO_207.B15]|nr:Mo-dependent nitrogenase C-terminal domain-containing protein [Xenococcaceae cyanobacterium MO_207.B15]
MNNLTLLFPVLHPLHGWLKSREINNPVIASIFIQIVPASCSFEGKSQLFKPNMICIPPLYQLNHFYKQFVILPCKYLVYLEEKCS